MSTSSAWDWSSVNSTWQSTSIGPSAGVDERPVVREALGDLEKGREVYRRADQQRRRARAYGDPSELTGDDLLSVFNVNVAGVVRTTTVFLSLLRRSSDPVIINVSSAMGSLSATHDTSRAESRVIAPVYTSSKATLTMLTTQYAKEAGP